jgi:hypothetical protein
MVKAPAPDDDDQPTGLIEPHRSVRDNSGIVRTEIDPTLVEKLAPVDALLARLDSATYYELLGVAPGASMQEIRRAYSQLAKRFHPDVFFRKRIGDYRAKLDRLFAALTRAYQVLIDDEERRVYNLLAGIEEPEPTPISAPASPRVSSVVERVEVRVPPAAPRISAAPRITSPVPAVPRVSSRPPHPSGADLAREALRRELSKRNSMAPRANQAPQSPAASSVQAAVRPAAAAGSLETLIAELERGTGIEVWVAARLRETRARERSGELTAALNILQLVITRFPDPRLREQCAQLRERALRGTKPR